jgi:hypothetical protein
MSKEGHGGRTIKVRSTNGERASPPGAHCGRLVRVPSGSGAQLDLP